MEVPTFTRITPEQAKPGYPLRLPQKRDIAVSAALFLLSRASVMGMFPFAPALFAAVYDKQAAYLGITVMLAGLLTKGAGMGCIKYIFCAVVFWLYSQMKNPKDNRILSSAVCGGAVLICGGVLLPYTNASIYGALLLVAESILTSFLYVVCENANTLVSGRNNRTQIGQEELVCLMICIGGIITGFEGIPLPYRLSIARLLTMYVVMTISMNMNLAMSCTGGLILGFLSGMGGGDAVLYMGIFGFCGMFANLLKPFGKIGVGLGFFGGMAIALLYVGNVFDFPIKIAEILFASLVFLGLPKRVHDKCGAFLTRSLHMETIRADVRIKGYLANRLAQVSSSFRKLEDCFFSVTEKRLQQQTVEVGDLFDHIADKVCRSCGMCRECWQTKFNDTYDRMYHILDVIEEKGYCDRTNVPETFKDNCVRLDSFLGEFAHAYELYKQQAIWEGEAVTERDLVAKQYGEVSEIMQSLSDEVESGFSFLDEMENRVVEELDKDGFVVREVSVIENGIGEIEVYLTVGLGTDVSALAEKLSVILDTPMASESVSGGTYRFVSANAFCVEVGVCQRNKQGENVCGDTAVHFRTEDNRYCIILCDGMGSGEKAAEESRLACTLLEEFMRAGFGQEISIKMINSTLALKMDKEMFSTIDLLVIDLTTGAADFYKIGAAESFIKKGKEIEVIFSKTYPAGILPQVDTDGVRRVFSGGEVIVMATDGVTEAGSGIIRGEWIRRAMYGSMDMQSLAEDIISDAEKKSGTYLRDDMTVAAVKIMRNE